MEAREAIRLLLNLLYVSHWQVGYDFRQLNPCHDNFTLWLQNLNLTFGFLRKDQVEIFFQCFPLSPAKWQQASIPLINTLNSGQFCHRYVFVFLSCVMAT